MYFCSIQLFTALVIFDRVIVKYSTRLHEYSPEGFYLHTEMIMYGIRGNGIPVEWHTGRVAYR